MNHTADLFLVGIGRQNAAQLAIFAEFEREILRELHHFNWKNLSLISGLTIWNLYFEMFPESIKAPHGDVLLRHLLQRIPGCLLIVWNGLAAHRSKPVKDDVA